MKKLLRISYLSGLMIAFSSVVSWASVAVSGSTVDVFAYDNSSSGGTGAETEIFLTAGDSFSVIAGVDDLWSAGANPRWSNAKGLVGYLYATGADQSGSPSGTLIGQNFDVCMDEPRISTINGKNRASGILVSFSPKTLAQRRRVRPCTNCERITDGLR